MLASVNQDFDVRWCREQFPGLNRLVDGQPAVFFDGPAGSQVPRRVIDAVSGYLAHCNANTGGEFATSCESDALLEAAHQAVADLFGSGDPDLIAFGPNMTTLTLALSRALAKTWRPGDEIIVTRSDHDANVTPWVLAARDAGAVVRHVRIHPDDCTLDLDDLRRQLCDRTRLAAIGCASNATGTVHPVGEIIKLVHAAGGQVFLDAVHHAPHLPIDVEAWDCEYVVASAYKFFGPHVGILWGKRQLLEELAAYKLRPASDTLPSKWMTGTQNHEGLAGTLAAVEYLADVGRRHQPQAVTRRQALLAAFEHIAGYERALAAEMLAGLQAEKNVRLYGLADRQRLAERVPTFCFTHARYPAQEVARHLGRRGVFCWHGNFYALPLSEALQLEPAGAVRAGLLHYNTREEIGRFLAALRDLH
jgi:cysteine desulfurase family protein (TIGR01976 family)